MPNPVQIWLTFPDARLRIPVNPESISVSTTHGYEDIEITQLGEYTVIGDAKLRDFSFSSFFPRDFSPSYCEYQPLPDPARAVARIEGAMKARKPVRLTITGTAVPINVLATVRKFDYEAERGGEPGDVYYEIALKEYVEIGARKIDLNAEKASVTGQSPRPDNREKPSEYVVKPGDTLIGVGLRLGKDWRDIYAANKATVGPDPNVIYPGQKLVLTV